MQDITLKRLEYAGWHEKRKIEINEIKKLFKSRNYQLDKKTEEFLIEYGMLEFEFSDRNPRFNENRHVNFNPMKALGKNLFKEGLDYLQTEYSDELNGKELLPIGQTENNNMLLLSSDKGEFYGYTDGCLVKYGDTIDEMLDCIVGECKMPICYDE